MIKAVNIEAVNIEVLELSDAKGAIGTFKVVDTWNGFKKLVPEHIALLCEAYDFGQFAHDFDQPLAKPIRAALRQLMDEVQAQYYSGNELT